MARGRGLLFLLLVATAASPHDDHATPPRSDAAMFSTALPGDVGDVSTWTVVSGEFETARVRGAYRFYVSPGRQGIYRLMRYNVQLLDPRNELERSRVPGERVVFVRRPGSHELLLCWERGGAVAPSGWRLVPSGTDAYRLEMGTLIQVLAVHRAARLAHP